jgi:predicted enzyme related to lactoylglutathione lyase
MAAALSNWGLASFRERRFLERMSTSENSGEYRSMKPGEISWQELITSDSAAAIAYYTKLFGWTTQPFRDGYTMFVQDGVPFGGVMEAPVAEIPTHWKTYVIVENLDASIAQAKELGGTLCWGPEEIPDVGRIAIVQDPTGAVIGLHEQPPA